MKLFKFIPVLNKLSGSRNGILCLIWFFCLLAFFQTSFVSESGFAEKNALENLYSEDLLMLRSSLEKLRRTISENFDTAAVILQLHECRSVLKQSDFWLRYLEPNAYRQINGPLPVEWEVEVFEKFESPYRREAGGLTLIEQGLDDHTVRHQQLVDWCEQAIRACDVFWHDSVRVFLRTPDAFFFSNRLFILNLTTIYNTGFECPDSSRIIPEIKALCKAVSGIYEKYNESFPQKKLDSQYLSSYHQLLLWLNSQGDQYSDFSHFDWISTYLEPLYAANQKFIRQYKTRSFSYLDFALSRTAHSILSKNLYEAQDDPGIFRPADTDAEKAEIIALGKLLFYDPLLSSNNQRACASCHIPQQMFTDTSVSTSFQFNHRDRLDRNTPSLPQAIHQHLLMHDGKHFSLTNQMKDVLSNPLEMDSDTHRILKKVLTCSEYHSKLLSLASLTSRKKIHMEHLMNAITMYYGSFAYGNSSFDSMVWKTKRADPKVVKGFNLFMGKAKCASCHFIPHFNGVKPPYIGSEFEVLGTPADTGFLTLSKDSGRAKTHPVPEMQNAFRTPGLRNVSRTSPYMHNGVFKSLEEVIEFYDRGGGAGRHLKIENQTLDAAPLMLTAEEKNNLILFMKSLNENIFPGSPPSSLPLSRNKKWNNRVVGGSY